MGSQGGQGQQGVDVGMGGLYPPGAGGAQWGGMGQGFEGAQQGQSPSESWSSATAVPATLNVEDWYVVFSFFLLPFAVFWLLVLGGWGEKGVYGLGVGENVANANG